MHESELMHNFVLETSTATNVFSGEKCEVHGRDMLRRKKLLLYFLKRLQSVADTKTTAHERRYISRNFLQKTS